MTSYVASVEELEELYGPVSENARRKVAAQLTPEYRRWIEAARFCVLASVGREGTDASPRGDAGPVVEILDAGHLLLPDWNGNNRIDSLRNIVEDGRVSLLFLAHGNGNVVRVNGRARISADRGLLDRFDRAGRRPRSVVVIAIAEVYFQCSRAVMRSKLWELPPQHAAALPTPGEILASMTGGRAGGADYDRAWPARAREGLW